MGAHTIEDVHTAVVAVHERHLSESRMAADWSAVLSSHLYEHYLFTSGLLSSNAPMAKRRARSF
jgi:hypothetical protein